MKPIAGIFMPWWGPAPGWQDQFIERSRQIESLVPILVGDAAKWTGPDIPKIPCTMDEFEARASEVAGVKIQKSDPRYSRGQSLCELRPLMADMYPSALGGIAWWGYGDWDVVWGDWDSFFAANDLSKWDIVSTNAKTVNGCLTIFRNTPEIANLYRKRMDLVTSPDMNGHLDETGMDGIVRSEKVRCLYLQNANAHDRHPIWNRCKLVDGKLYRMDAAGNLGGEILKFHFPAGDKWPL